MKIKNNQAFTLAEVLVTLAVIGIVSAMTIPTLMNNWQKDSYETRTKQAYSILSQAILQYKTDKNAISLSESGLRSVDKVEDFMTTYLKVNSICGGTKTPCFADSYKNISGTVTKNWNATQHYTLAGGQSLGVDWGSCGSDTNQLFRFYTDINGPKGPNTWGRDIMVFHVYKNGNIIVSENSDCAVADADRMDEVAGDSGEHVVVPGIIIIPPGVKK